MLPMSEIIEGMEQTVIQHIRTAGIVNKSKETSLVDKVLDLRRERRRVFSATLNELESVRKEVTELQLRLQKAEADIIEATSELERATLQHKSELQNCTASIKADYNMMFQKQQQNEKSTIYEVRQKYETKIKLLESKINEVFEEKMKSDRRDAQSIASDLIRKAAEDIEAKYLAKMKEYKSTILAIATREKELERQSDAIALELLEAKKGNRVLVDKLSSLQSLLTAAEKKAYELELRNCELSASLQHITESHKKGVLDHEEKEEVYRRQLKAQSQQHVEQLSLADEKVRRLLDVREQVRLDETQKLKRLLEESESRRYQAEEMLHRINEDISSASMSAARSENAYTKYR